MVIIIFAIWFFLTIPIVYQVDKQLKGSENDWIRHKVLFQIILIWKSFWGVPIYYFLLLKEIFIKKEN